MGCFDTVMVPCPKCGTRREFQSKGGDCILKIYPLEAAPSDVLSDVNRHAPLRCDECGTLFKVGPGPRPVAVDDGPLVDIERVLSEVWRSLQDDHSAVALTYGLTFVEAYGRAGLLSRNQAELWRLRMQHECPEGKGQHEGGRAWCGFCGETPERFPETTPEPGSLDA